MERFNTVERILRAVNRSRLGRCQRILSLSHFGTLLLILFAVPTFASADCEITKNDSQICSVEVNFAGQKRSYLYEIRAAENGKPTIVEVPGGPGQGYVGRINEAISGGLIPIGYGVIAISPRGVGPNDYGPDKSGGNYTSDLEVNDIVAIIRKERLQNYIIHGQSYGSLVATKLGAHLSNDSLVEKPRAIVLSGVVNRAFDDQISGYNRQLKRIIKDFSPQEKAQLQNALSKLLESPFNGDQNAFSSAVMSGLLFNIEVENSIFGPRKPDFRQFLKMLSSGKIDTQNQVYQLMLNAARRNIGKTPDFSEVKRRNTMAEEVKCTEMSTVGEEARVSFDFSSLQLKVDQSDCKKKGYQLSNPYDSSASQIFGIATYYFQGTLDPATPDSEAKNHYGSQLNTEKIYISINGYSHTNLLGLVNCQTGLWEAIAQGPSKLEEQLKGCDDSNIKILGYQKPE